MELKAFEDSHAAVVASWASTAQEVALLSGREEYPFPADLVGSWRKVADDIASYLYFDGGAPVGYGELWLDDEEDEVELARIIVAPDLRGQGIGAEFVRALLQPALAAGYSAVFLRVRPDNERAIRTYLRVGFQPVDERLAAEWNEPQPINYAWLQYPTVNAK
ncbi:acetyltransferase (GNAT) family protein [Kribbella voronezhensis]|uniref:Acetyltransferase (GNAT) family protein n=1 Tax=Kribbella voronezhensis TaxID=2512212 RepID=A0A4R7TIE7_9ACTN|nr:GNAT family N-acetyltransferase [Kribbella voronezhensis]TDU91267.1 acetyltransferase (GNAT) family protein [Kribbella voronezhensis]